MPAKTPLISRVVRSASSGQKEEIELQPGLNLVVGMPNTGKTQWLRMLNFLLGDSDQAEDAFDEDLAAKYTSLEADLVVGGEALHIERRWQDPKLRSKVLVDGQAMTVDAYTDSILSRLGIPPFRFPQGNPLGPRSWPTLGWRSLLRHIYRRQSSWTDLASQQPESEQHAVLVQFLGAAPMLFSENLGKLADKQKGLVRLQAAKEEFYGALNLVSKKLLSEGDASVAVTEESINAAMERLRKEAEQLQGRRAALVEEIQTAASGSQESELARLTESVARAGVQKRDLEEQHEHAVSRLAELEEYQRRVEQERKRLVRARVAGSLFTQLRVTHCPACDRPVQPSDDGADCYVCHRPDTPASVPDSRQRVDLELQQLDAEQSEAEELLAAARTEVERTTSLVQESRRDLQKIEANLVPLRSRAAAVLPPELGQLDMHYGQIQAQVEQLERTRDALAHRDHLSAEIAKVEEEIAHREADVGNEKADVDLGHLGDVLADAMNSYLSELRRAHPSAWTQDRISVDLHERTFTIRVGDKRWSKKLGGTLQLVFLVAYSYALLSLSNQDGFNFPGLLILDLPAKLDDGSSTADTESHVLEPFCALLQKSAMANTQVIVAGNAFVGLLAHRQGLNTVWK